MRLARSEGRITKWREVLKENTFRDLQILAAFYQLEPWGEERADLREATMTSVLAKVWGCDVDPNRLKDYLAAENEIEDYDEYQSPEVVAAMMRQMFPNN